MKGRDTNERKGNCFKKICMLFSSLALMCAPVASEFCRGLFYQPEIPKELAELKKK